MFADDFTMDFTFERLISQESWPAGNRLTHGSWAGACSTGCGGMLSQEAHHRGSRLANIFLGSGVPKPLAHPPESLHMLAHLGKTDSQDFSLQGISGLHPNASHHR